MDEVTLREVAPSDIVTFFEHQRDPDACEMAAFTAGDPNDFVAFETLWNGLLANDTIVKRTIVAGDEIVGNILHFVQFGQPAVGYWIARRFWGRGIATAALRAMLDIVQRRPLYARVAFDNIGSARVLEKCGFTAFMRDRGYANARKKEIVELVYVLPA